MLGFSLLCLGTLTLPSPIEGEGEIKKMGVKIDTLRCTGCEACVYVCPVGVLFVEDMKCRVSEGCIFCGLCVDYCQWQAITLEKQPKSKKAKKRNK